MITAIAKSLVEGHTDKFTDSRSASDIVVLVIVWAVIVVLILIVGQWLWNEVGCKLLTICKPAPTVWHILGLVVLLDLLLPGCLCK